MERIADDFDHSTTVLQDTVAPRSPQGRRRRGKARRGASAAVLVAPDPENYLQTRKQRRLCCPGLSVLFSSSEEDLISAFDASTGRRTLRSLLHMLLWRPLRAVGLPASADRAARTRHLKKWWVALAVALLLYVGLYAAADRFASYFTLGSAVSPWYPPAGVHLMFALYVGPCAWPVLWGVELLSAFAIFPTGFAASTNVVWTLIKTALYAMEAAVLLMIDASLALNLPWRIARFALVVSVAHLIIGLGFTAALAVEGIAFDYGHVLVGWVLGDVSGILAVTVLWVALRNELRVGFKKLDKHGWLGLAALLLSFGLALCFSFWPDAGHPRYFLLLLPLLIAGFYFGVVGAALTFVCTAFGGVSILHFVLVEEVAAMEELIFQLALIFFGLVALMVGAKSDMGREMQRLANEACWRAEELTEARSRLLETVSHELKTPLHGVEGMLEHLSATELSSEQQQMVESARISAFSLSMLVRDVLAFRKAESGALSYSPEPFSGAALCRHLDTLIDVFAHQQQQQLRQSAEVHLLVFYPLRLQTMQATPFMADLFRVRQVLINLVSNAMKFTNDGCIQLRCEAHGTRFRFTCCDTGIGMNEATLTNLFARFHQASAQDEYAKGGTGLGMFISKKIAEELLQGTLEVESTVGEGTTFALEFDAPGARPNRSLAGHALRVSEMLPLRGGAERSKSAASVALVSRNDDVAQHVELLLSELELQHVRAASVAEAAQLRDVCAVIVDRPGADAALSEVAVPLMVLHVVSVPMQCELPPDALLVSLPLRPSTVYDAFGSLKLCGSWEYTEKAGSPRVVSGRSSPTALRRYSVSKVQPLGRLRGTRSLAFRSKKQPLRVLLVDDNVVNLQIASRSLKRLLPHMELVIVTAGNGQEAIEVFLSQQQFHVIFMDLNMPLINGCEATAQIRKHERAFEWPPVDIVVVTASDGKRLVQAEEAGCNYAMFKPFTMDSFRYLLTELGVLSLQAMDDGDAT